jgi:hypothetical protein
MSYENAPATEMVATFCACCSRPLVDAVSVETGVGPECRKKHGFNTAQAEADWSKVAEILGDAIELPEDAQAAANKLVHMIAIAQDGVNVNRWIAAVAALGFTKLADRCAKRVGGISVSRGEGDCIEVRAPFCCDFIDAAKARGARWSKPAKAWVFGADARRLAWDAIKASFPAGTVVKGPLGMAVL